MHVFPEDAGGGEVHAAYTHRETFPLKVLSEAVNRLDFGLLGRAVT
jgi:hypothetical protein